MSISVLVVEDQPELGTTIQNMLAEHGYAVRCVATVEEAVLVLNEIPHPCLVLWDPATLPVSAALVAHTARHGVHLATIPVGITSTGLAADGSPMISKRLTSREAILNVVREHCRPDEEERAAI